MPKSEINELKYADKYTVLHVQTLEGLTTYHDLPTLLCPTTSSFIFLRGIFLGGIIKENLIIINTVHGIANIVHALIYIVEWRFDFKTSDSICGEFFFSESTFIHRLQFWLLEMLLMAWTLALAVLDSISIHFIYSRELFRSLLPVKSVGTAVLKQNLNAKILFTSTRCSYFCELLIWYNVPNKQ